MTKFWDVSFEDVDKAMHALTRHFLDMLVQRLHNDGCNDFDLAAVVPDVEVRRWIMREAFECAGIPDDFDEGDEYRVVLNWMVADWCEYRLGKRKW